MSRFTNRWGNLPQLQLPSFMMTEGILTLGAAELKVLVALLHLHKSRAKRRRRDETVASVKVSQAVLMERTGYPRTATISAAVHGLQDAGFIQIVRDRSGSSKRGEASSEYILTDPDTREPLRLTLRSSNILGSLGMRYFTIPVCLLTTVAHWSWAKLTGSEARLYIAISWTANRERSHRFERTNAQMYRTAGFTSLATFKKALDGLQRHGLIFVSEGETTNAIVIQLCNPFTRETPHTPDGNDRNDPANYTTADGRRFSWNEGTDSQWEQMVRDAVPAGEPVIKQRNGDLLIRCAFHNDRTPSCSVSPSKRCYHCFGCGAVGTLRVLLARLTGCTMSDTIGRIARGLGTQAEFREPDSNVIAMYDNAIATYDYIDARGVPLKQVLRLPDDEHGKKQFIQRRWTGNAWVPGVKGVGPVLYNAHRISTAGTVVIVEGEKDADSITNLHLGGYGGDTIGVTSGGSRSWDHKLAKQLRHKVVIVMPDNDAPGEAYAEAVRASLDAESIKYKTVSFAGTGAKDVTEYLETGHTAEDLVQLIDCDWVRMPEGTHPAIANELRREDNDFIPA